MSPQAEAALDEIVSLLESIDLEVVSLHELLTSTPGDTGGPDYGGDSGGEKGGGKTGKKDDGGGDLLGISAVTGVVGQFASSLFAVVGQLTALTGAVAAFVGAISPSTLQVFNDALAGLQATIGSAFVPALQVAAGVVREMAGVLLPLMNQLQPVFTQLAETVGGLLVTQVRLWASVVAALLPVFQVVVDAYAAYAGVIKSVIEVLVVLVRTVAAVLTPLLGGLGLGDVFRQIADRIREVIKQLVVFGASLAAAFGLGEFVSQLQQQFARLAAEEETRAAGLHAAAKTPAIESIESIGKKFAQASFVAQGAGAAREKTDTDFLKSISEELGKVLGENKDWKTVIREAIEGAWRTIKAELPGAAAVGQTAETVREQVYTPDSAVRRTLRFTNPLAGFVADQVF